MSTTNVIEVLHHFQRMPQPIGGGSVYAGQVVAINGDVDPDLRSVTFVTVGEGQFHRAAVAGLVPTAAHLDALLAQQQGADADNLIQAPAAANNDFVEIATRRAVYAPYWIAGLLIAQNYSRSALAGRSFSLSRKTSPTLFALKQPSRPSNLALIQSGCPSAASAPQARWRSSVPASTAAAFVCSADGTLGQCSGTSTCNPTPQ